MTDPILDTCTTDDLLRWLRTAARDDANDRHLAAIDLLDFASLLDRRDVRAHIRVGAITHDDEPDDPGIAAAWIDYAALADTEQIGPLSGAHDKLLALAVSIAGGTPVDLRRTLFGLGEAHSRAVLSAFAVALGLGGDVEITDTPAYLARARAREDALAHLLAATDTA